jgi:LysR family transcriptional regulator, transcriptional activator of nhaA
MQASFSYRHLHYFWVVATEGGIARAAARLGMAVQTVSAQVHELERELGVTLLQPAGRRLALTEAGRLAFRQAEHIFQLGEQLPALVRDATRSPVARLAVGISDGLPKLVVRRLLQPVLREPNLRLLCHEGEFEELQAELALHRLDVVLADRPATPSPNLRVFSHSLGAPALAWYAPRALLARARRGFPASFAQVPVLLPTTHAAVRPRLDAWFERHGVRPNVVGEFEDSALLATFASSGMGAFPAPEVVRHEMARHYGIGRVAACDGVEEHLFAIGTERKVAHRLVQRMLDAARATRRA